VEVGMRKKLIITGILIGMIIIGIVSFKLTLGSIDRDVNDLSDASEVVNPIYFTQEPVMQNSSFAETEKLVQVIEEPLIENQPLLAATNMVHDMANSLIKSDHIWYTLSINKATVEELMKLINSIEECEEKSVLLRIAEGWKKGDFTNIQHDHNEVWNMLDGTIGKATGVNEEAVAEAVSALK